MSCLNGLFLCRLIETYSWFLRSICPDMYMKVFERGFVYMQRLFLCLWLWCMCSLGFFMEHDEWGAIHSLRPDLLGCQYRNSEANLLVFTLQGCDGKAGVVFSYFSLFVSLMSYRSPFPPMHQRVLSVCVSEKRNSDMMLHSFLY